MLCGFLAFGGILFWCFLALISILFCASSEWDDEPGWTIGGVILFGLLWFLCGDLTAVFKNEGWKLAYWIPGYIGAGLIWTFPRWLVLLKRAKKEYKQALAAFKPEKERPHFVHSWDFQRLEREYGFSYDADNKITPPSFEHNRSRMINWVLLWPWSIFWTFCRDGLYQLTDALLGIFGGWHQRLSNWMFKDTM